MTQQNDRNDKEILVIAKADDGFRVYSPANPSKSYLVSGSTEAPQCTCLDFQYHEGDPDWRCRHIAAVLDQLSRCGPAPNGAESYATQERAAIQEEANSKPNGFSEMLIKRSVSPDGRIDSLSVEFSCSVEGKPVGVIRSQAQYVLELQSQIVGAFLRDGRNGNRQENGQRNDNNGAVPARMLNVGGMNGKWGRRLFINFQVNGQTLKLFGSSKQLAEFIAVAGPPLAADQIIEGMQLNIPCRVTTKPSPDGKYVNIDQVLAAGQQGLQHDEHDSGTKRGGARLHAEAAPLLFPHQPLPALPGAVPALLQRQFETQVPFSQPGVWPDPAPGSGFFVPHPG
jgi:hypothetical protein